MLRAVFRTLDALCPGLTSRMIARAFSRPRRLKRSPKHTNPYRGKPYLLANSGCAVWTEGHGPLILLVHGWEADHRDMDAIAAALLRSNYRVAALDLPAHGLSPGRTASIPELSNAIRDLLHDPEFESCAAFVAHSLGGAAAVRAAAASGREIPLVLIASPSQASEYLRARITRLGLPASRCDRVVREYLRLRGVDLMQIDVAIDAPSVRGEVLLIYGETDSLVPLSEGLRYRHLLSKGHLLVVRGAGHRGMLGHETVLSAVVGFVDRAISAQALEATARSETPRKAGME